VAVRRYVTPGRLLALGLVLFAVVFALWVIPSNEYIFLPDRAKPVDPLVTVAGGHEPHNGGGIYFVDVIVRKATILERLFGGLHKGASLVPASEVLGPGLSTAQEHDEGVAEMTQSQQFAAAVAFRALGRKVTTTPDGATVEELEPGSPAAAKLAPDDVIVAVDGKPVKTLAAVSSAMKGKRVGEKVTFTIHRGSTEKAVVLRTIAAGPKSHRAIVGMILTQADEIHLPEPVSIDANGVVGPSAGLAFALDLLQKLGRNVDHGRKVAATGEINLNGSVSPIGGIKQKTFGARAAGVDVFLVPAGQNARDARKYAHGLRIIPVKNFQQALHALATLPPSR
jgi:PDZ domain-containing protein